MKSKNVTQNIFYLKAIFIKPMNVSFIEKVDFGYINKYSIKKYQ